MSSSQNLKINFINETRWRLPRQLLTALLTFAYELPHLGDSPHPSNSRRKIKRPPATVNLLVIGDARTTELNAQFLKHNFTTDVIAFPNGAEWRSRICLGDIAVNAELATREAHARNWDFRYELGLYALHGTLHLLGYDDHSPRDIAAMIAAEKRAFAHLGIVCRI